MAELSSVNVKLTGDASGLKAALSDAKGELKQTSQDAEKTTASLRGMARGLAGVAAAAVGITGIASIFRNVASEAQTFETSLLRINAVIRATGGAAGRTSSELLSFARNLALNTLESTEGVLEAQQRLLTFRRVSGDVFDRAITASADLAAAMGQNLSGAAVMLGRALEDPVRGLTALTRTGTVFTESQKDVIEQLVATGQLQQAQIMILRELESQYGGTAQAAAQGYAGALDTLAQRQQEFFLAINDTLGVTDALSAAANSLARVFQVLAENMQRIVTYIATAAVAGFVVFRGAIIGAAASIASALIPSLVGLRVALIRTGVGVLVVALGEAVYQFSRLSSAAAGFGNALALIGDVFQEVFARMGRGFSILGELVEGAAMMIQGAFQVAFSSIASGFNDLVLVPVTQGINLLKSALNSLPGVDVGGPLEMPTLGSEGSEAGQYNLSAGQGIVSSAAGSLGALFQEPLESVQAIRDLFAQMREENLTLPEILGLSGEDQQGDGGGGTMQERLDDELSAMEERIREHYDIVANLAKGGLSDKLGAWGNYFSNLISLTGSNNKRLLAVSKAFTAAQALIDAYGAYVKVLNDPTPQPWFVRLAAAANVFAAGIGAVSAIKSVGSSGGGGAAPSQMASAASSAGAVSGGAGGGGASRNVAIQLMGGDMFSRDQVIQLINSINEAVEDGAIVRLA